MGIYKHKKIGKFTHGKITISIPTETKILIILYIIYMKKALVIDDSETMRSMASLVLKNLNFHTESAANGELGVDKFKKEHFDLILTDINMPRMNGIDVIKSIRKENTDIPILVLTTESEDSMRKRGFQEGANGWVVKPFKPAILSEIVNQLVT